MMNTIAMRVYLAIAGCLLPMTMSAQARGLTQEALQQQRQNAPAELDPHLIVVERKQPREFVPFEMVDVVTKAPIRPDSMIVLPDGKHAPAADYFRHLNEIEKGLNELGYSLRDESWESIVIQRSAINTEAMTAQLREIRAATNSSRSFRPKPIGDLVREATLRQPGLDELIDVGRSPNNIPAPSSSGTKIAPRPSTTAGVILGTGKLNLPPKPTVVTESHEYPFSLGDPKLFAAGVNGKLDLTGSEENMKLTGAARANVSIFGISSDVARLDGWMNAPKKGNMTGKITLDVLPFGTIYNLALDGASVSKSDSMARGIDVEFASFRVMIGPVPVKVQAGAQGSVGLRYYAGLNPASAIGEFAPIVRSNLYVQAGVDIVVAGAGAGAAMTLVNYDLSMYGALRLWMQTPEGAIKPQLGIRRQFEVSHKLQMLSGNAYAYAYIYYPACCVPPWKKKEWRWEIFNWGGFTPVDGNLADIDQWTSLSK